MKTVKNFRFIVKWGLLSAVAVTCMLPGIVMADPGLKVDGAVVSGEVVPGETYHHDITISSDADDPSYEIELTPMGLGQTLNGAYQELEGESDSSPYSARDYVTDVDITTFTLEPSQEKRVRVIISVPEQVTPGGKYACIYVRATPKGSEEGLASIPSVHIPVVLTVGPTESLTTLGKITDLSVNELIIGKPIEVLTTLENTGNYHYRAKDDVALLDADGNIIAYSSTKLTYSSIVPTFAYQFKGTISVEQSLPMGTYYIESKASLEDGTVLDVKRTIIELTKVYYTDTSQDEEPITIQWFFIGFVLLILLVIGLLLLLIAQRKKVKGRLHEASKWR